MTWAFALRIGAAAAIVLAVMLGVNSIRENGKLRAQLDEQNEKLTNLLVAQGVAEGVQIDNDAFDGEVRGQQQQVTVVVRDARSKDHEAAALLDTRLPASLRVRVFDNDDPTDVAAGRRTPAAAGEDRGQVPLDRSAESRP